MMQMLLRYNLVDPNHTSTSNFSLSFMTRASFKVFEFIGKFWDFSNEWIAPCVRLLWFRFTYPKNFQERFIVVFGELEPTTMQGDQADAKSA